MNIQLFTRLGLLGRKWYFRIVAANGKTIAQSEAYSRHIDCMETAYSLRDNLESAEVVDVEV